jgi:hypothetical protein
LTALGGAAGLGTIFHLKALEAQDGGWTESLLYSFTGGSDGGRPTGLSIHGGRLYGATYFDGGNGGTVFSLNLLTPAFIRR